jgi:hypothetical protein
MVCGRHIIFMSNKKAWQKINQKKTKHGKSHDQFKSLCHTLQNV